MGRGAVVVVAMAGLASGVAAQAPLTAQVWEVRYVVDERGPMAAGPGATAVGITIQARVAILPNTTALGTTNLGVARVGGAGSATTGFRLTFSDATAAALGTNQGRIDRGATGQTFLDTEGEPVAGHFTPFRGLFSPQVGPFFVGSNSDPANGRLFNPAMGPVILANLVGARGPINFGSDGTGPVGVAQVDASGALVGDFADVYRMVYSPAAFPGEARTVTMTVVGMSARYLPVIQSDIPITPLATPFPERTMSFVVPSAGGAAAGWIAAAALGVRRRRACSVAMHQAL